MKTTLKVFASSLLCFALLVPFSGQAQSEKTWSIGPELGVSFSKIGRDASDTDFKTGAVAGFFLTHSIVNSFGITGKALLYQKGYQVPVGNTTNKYTFNYLEIPILGRFFLTKEGKFRPNLFVGPSFGFLMGGTIKTGDNEAVKIANYKNSYNTFDFGVTGGLGLNFEIANETRLLLDARYTHGLSDVSKSVLNNLNTNNQSINVSLGVSFGF
ncbi:MAG: porin family protein [Bacteroidota bacterium]